MSRKCAKCGIVSDIDDAFHQSDSSGKVFHCPQCVEKKENQLGQSYLIACFIILVGGALWLILDPQNELALLILETGLLGFFIGLSALPHELGHVFAALLTKAKILRVNIGLGRILYSCFFCEIEWRFCIFPIGGFIFHGISNNKFYRTRSFLISLGGPLANCLMIFAGIILILHISTSWFLVIIKPFIAANILVLIYDSLLPKKIYFAGREMSSDGLRLLTVPFMSDSEVNKEIESYYVWQGYNYYTRNLIEQAKQIYEIGLSKFPDSPALRNGIGKILLLIGQCNEARNLFIQLEKNYLNPAMKIEILNAIASADIMIGDNALLEEADAYSKTACESMPWQTEFKVTRGLVLIKKGDKEHGLALLKEVIDKIENSSDKANFMASISKYLK